MAGQSKKSKNPKRKKKRTSNEVLLQKVWIGVEPTTQGYADQSLTAWLPHHKKCMHNIYTAETFVNTGTRRNNKSSKKMLFKNYILSPKTKCNTPSAVRWRSAYALPRSLRSLGRLRWPPSARLHAWGAFFAHTSFSFTTAATFKTSSALFKISCFLPRFFVAMIITFSG